MEDNRKLILVLAALSLGAAALALAAVGELPVGLTQLTASACVSGLIMLSLALLGALAIRRAPSEALGFRASRLSPWAIGALVVATLGASHSLFAVLSLLDLRDDNALREFARLLAGARGMELASALLALGLLPAFAEELLCRGLIQRGLVRRVGAAGGIATSSALFPLLHADPVHVALAAPLGAHLGTVAWWGDSTRPAFLCHAVNNLAAVLIAALAADPPGSAWLHVGLGGAIAGGGWLAALALQARAAASPLQRDPGSDDE